jgi:hypothetical protein
VCNHLTRLECPFRCFDRKGIPDVDGKPAEIIKPIETRYKGYRFRSRLEARWAVWFDHLGLEWQYEPERFPVGDCTYLPDFWLPDLGCWAEVKGVVDQSTLDLLVAAANPHGGLPADPTGRAWARSDGPARMLLLGQIPAPTGGWVHTRFDFREGEVHLSTVAFQSVMSVEVSRPMVSRPVLIGEPAPPSAGWVSSPERRSLLAGRDHGMLKRDGFVHEAYMAARSARFEYGDSGAPAKSVAAPVAVADATPALVSSSKLLFASESVPRPRSPRRRPPRPERSGPKVFEQMWPGMKTAIAERDPDLGDVLVSAKVALVRKRTVTLLFADERDRGVAAAGVDAICDAARVASGIGPWVFRCEQAEGWVAPPQPPAESPILFGPVSA